ncbi:MAG: GNAT family N-acetyltransferase [Bacteroidota bacterium]
MITVFENISTILQTVSPADAADICKLRNNPGINKYLSSSEAVSEDQQRIWINNNLEKGDGLYLKILDRKSREFSGTISIYNVDRTNNYADFGRYICTSPLHSIEAEWMVLQIGFDIMRLEKMYCRTAEENTKVWNQHYKFGFIDDGFELLEPKKLVIRKQELTTGQFRNFDYSKIIKLIERFGK